MTEGQQRRSRFSTSSARPGKSDTAVLPTTKQSIPFLSFKANPDFLIFVLFVQIRAVRVGVKPALKPCFVVTFALFFTLTFMMRIATPRKMKKTLIVAARAEVHRRFYPSPCISR